MASRSKSGLPFCAFCYGKGAFRDKSTRRFVKCHCGRLINSEMAGKLARQAKLDERMENVKKGGW